MESHDMLDVTLKRPPVLEDGFLPASLWNRAYRSLVAKHGAKERLIVCFERNGIFIEGFETYVLPHISPWRSMNIKYVERLLKLHLWVKGGHTIHIDGNDDLARELGGIYSANGERSFDHLIMGYKILQRELTVRHSSLKDIPLSAAHAVPIARSLDGCRIGFDLGGSDRKCAAVIDGKIVHSEEIAWRPYYEKDAEWHRREIVDSIQRAAAKLPRVDGIGGSAAGIYIDNRVCFASLFRSVDDESFDRHVRGMFIELAQEWNGIPFIVVNDGKVSALAASMMIDGGGLLGVSMGTSQATGYVAVDGRINDWLNDLSFSPIDYGERAPVDEWSGDRGCGVQYFSQQAVARLAPKAGIHLPDGMGFPERLSEVQLLVGKGDARAGLIFKSIGACLGYAIAHYSEIYEINHLMLFGRVVSGVCGDLILAEARDVLKAEFPELEASIKFHVPDERMKRHGQAIAAASLPIINNAAAGDVR